MHRYAVWGFELQSTLRLPSLRPADPIPPPGASQFPFDPRRILTFYESPSPFGEPDRWIVTEMLGSSTQKWRAVGASPRGYVVRLFGAVDFLLERDASTAHFFVDPGASIGVVEPLFLEQALPLWLSSLGCPCLHASAVAWGEGEGACAIAFSGRSGAGKSTLATMLASRAQGLIADDCLPLEIVGDQLLAHPGHRAVRLLPDSAAAIFSDPRAGDLSLDGAKRRIDVPAADQALPLTRLYALEPSEDVARVTRLRPRDALGTLATHLFRVDPEDASRLPGELDLLARLTERVRVARLHVPRRYDALDDVRKAIADDLADG